MTAERRTAIGALLFVYVVVRLFWWLDEQHASAAIRFLGATGLLKVVVWVVPAIGAVLIGRPGGLRDALASLGFDADIPRGIRFGFLATVPLAIVATFAPERIDPVVLIGTALVGPFAEEVLFRGFLMNALVSRARWPAAAAIAVSAIVFGIAHVGNLDLKVVSLSYRLLWPALATAGIRGDELAALVVEIAPLAAGGLVFGWIFHRFGSLWPVIAFHGCLNLWITLADGDRPGPVIGLAAAAQIASFGLALLLTLRPRPVVTSASPVRLS